MAGNKPNKSPWGGRFKKETDPLVRRFTRSLHLDRRLAFYDLAGSRVHARMLAQQGLLSAADRDSILKGLNLIEEELLTGSFPFRDELEDIHMNIEVRLSELVGEPGARLHTARSRNDQVALDMKLFCLDTSHSWQLEIFALQGSLLQRAGRLQELLLPGWTHLQAAQPISWAHYLLAFCDMFERDYQRLGSYRKLHDVSPLGAGALSGSTLPIDPRYSAAELGFRSSFNNSYDVVGDRDFVLELVQIGTQIMLHGSRLAEDFIYLSSSPVAWIELPDELCTGSSMMPQKKNPDLLELVRGKTASVLGHETALATLLKGLPSSYHRDLQQDKEHLFAVADTVSESLQVMRLAAAQFSVREAQVRQALNEGFLAATDLAEYLVECGMPFRDAHQAVGRLVAHCVQEGLRLDQLRLETLRRFIPECEEGVEVVLAPGAAFRRRKHSGSSGPASIRSQLEVWAQRQASRNLEQESRLNSVAKLEG